MTPIRVLKIAADGRAGKDVEKAVSTIKDESVRIERKAGLEGPEALKDDGHKEGESTRKRWSGWVVAKAVEMATERKSTVDGETQWRGKVEG